MCWCRWASKESSEKRRERRKRGGVGKFSGGPVRAEQR